MTIGMEQLAAQDGITDAFRLHSPVNGDRGACLVFLLYAHLRAERYAGKPLEPETVLEMVAKDHPTLTLEEGAVRTYREITRGGYSIEQEG